MFFYVLSNKTNIKKAHTGHHGLTEASKYTLLFLLGFRTLGL